ncbi:RGCVC family protein [Actinomycetospora chiangmaiensis]|uniref:RGCVC family protein n=1 Tax=Actinomycetospora chiangmaiensis TaxID=402650 RepID=UPI000A2F37C1|nr:RGCVC family protein [Actinomycetospora chiangmaiensis]
MTEQRAEPATGASDPTCAMCPHPWSAHDALGRRFCTATQVGVWTRGCICTPPRPR